MTLHVASGESVRLLNRTVLLRKILKGISEILKEAKKWNTDTVSPPLSTTEDTSQDSQWMSETMESTKHYMYYEFFLYGIGETLIYKLSTAI